MLMSIASAWSKENIGTQKKKAFEFSERRREGWETGSQKAGFPEDMMLGEKDE
jgi:hypothetical protein